MAFLGREGGQIDFVRILREELKECHCGGERRAGFVDSVHPSLQAFRGISHYDAQNREMNARRLTKNNIINFFSHK